MITREFSTRRLDDTGHGEPRYRVSWYHAETDVQVRSEVVFGDPHTRHSHVAAIQYATGLAANDIEPVHTASTVQQWHNEKGA